MVTLVVFDANDEINLEGDGSENSVVHTKRTISFEVAISVPFAFKDVMVGFLSCW